MKLCYCLVWIIFLSATGFSQDRDFATIHYTLSRLNYGDTAAHAKQLDIKFRLPAYRNNKNISGITPGYKYVLLDHFPGSYSPNLHGITLQGTWIHRFNNRQTITLFAQAGLFSDMKDISAKDFRYTAGIRYRQKHSVKLTSGWGLAYSRQFFGNQVTPFIDVDYQPNERWSISGQFPIKPKILYHFNKKLSAGIEVNGEVTSYRLSATEKNNRFIQINQWAGLVKLEYKLAKAWQLHFGIGENFKQSYKLYDNASTNS